LTDHLQQLNPAQREAVTHGEGPLLVLAGAGSGKTRVLTHRVAHLVAAGRAAPHELTAVTFTNKAAREMRERVVALMGGGDGLGGVFLGTFHRWALELLRRHPEPAGLPARFTILDRDDQLALLKRVLEEAGVDPKAFTPRSVLGAISAAANGGLDPDRYEGGGGSPGREVVAGVWRRYGEAKRKAGAVDFDDMLVLALRLLREDETIRTTVRRRARWLLVDEFQDTNSRQQQLVYTLAAFHKSQITNRKSRTGRF